jgi:hypothetical protein
MAQLVFLVWYLAGLVLLFKVGFYWWFAFGILLPIIPYVYSIVYVLG